ncbi:Hypothetical protein A7982_07187 [Minicystis rosea]|nr:Hypothetical protein A7982_07187 [Minicystis rosea]
MAQVPKVKIKVLLRRGRKVLSDQPYVVRGLPGDPMTGTTDGEGKVELQVPVTVREIVIILPEKKLSYPLLIGDLDPMSEESGVRKRLHNLGHLREPKGDDDRPQSLARAVRAFQAENELEATGELDETTRDALERGHGR